MRELDVSVIRDTVARLCIEANTCLPEDVKAEAEVQRMLSSCHNGLGVCLLAQNKATEALAKYEAALAGGDRAAAEVAYKDAIVIVDKAVTKGILHKNTAARKKSSMTLRLNKMA
jgi:small subunit ribosomal protein S20